MFIQHFTVATFISTDPPFYKEIGIVEAADTHQATMFCWEQFGERTLIVEPIDGTKREIKAFVHEPRLIPQPILQVKQRKGTNTKNKTIDASPVQCWIGTLYDE